MFKRNTHTLLISALVSIFLLAACQPPQAAPSFECTDAIGCVTIAPGDPIKLAAIQVLSADLALAGTEHVQSVELAIDKRDGQLLGHPIALQKEDSKCSPEGGANAALKVVADPQVLAIIGPLCSGAAATAGEVMSESGLIMVSGANTAPSLTSVGGAPGDDWQPGYFRTTHNDSVKGRVAAVFALQELGVTKAATINDGEIFSQQFVQVFEQTFKELGGEIVLSTAVNKGDTDMQPVLTAVEMSGAELLFFPLVSPEGDFVVQQIKEVPNLENVFLLSDDALLSAAFMEGLGPENDREIYFFTPAVPEAQDELAAEYEAKYGEKLSFSFYSFTYDATNMVLNAIEAVAVQEPDGTLHIGRQALREAMYNTSGFEGVTGTLTCDKFGDCGTSKFYVVKLDGTTADVDAVKANIVYTYTPDS
ncbi:MAG: branched-chain amino acid ABC transporter substrate-binding protein [Anaerolineae bacterium]